MGSKFNTIVFLRFFSVLMLSQINASAQTIPSSLTPAQLNNLSASVLRVDADGMNNIIVIPQSPQAYIDSRDGQVYHTVCYGYAGNQDSQDHGAIRYTRRFAVYAPHADDLPIARRAARLLVLIYSEVHTRLKFDHPFGQALFVFLNPNSYQNADAGGEQFRDRVYIFSIYSHRSPIEWMREIAHEYGHYILPGVTGFTSPEAWANGVLGERLFLYWIGEDTAAGNIDKKELPFVTTKELEDYQALQTIPLISRIQRRTILSSSYFSRTDSTGMDDYTALVLYTTALYGSSQLRYAFSYTAPQPGTPLVKAPDFLKGVEHSLDSADSLLIHLPVNAHSKIAPLLIYLPKGQWKLAFTSALKDWKIDTGIDFVHLLSTRNLLVHKSGWYATQVTLNSASTVRTLLFTASRR